MALSPRAFDLLRSDPELHAYVSELEQIGLAFRRAPVGIALAAPDGRLLQVNAALCDTLARPADELLRASLGDLTHPDDRDAGAQPLRDVLDGRLDRYRVEQRFSRGDGSAVWCELTASLVRDDAGLPAGVIAQLVDVSERRRVEDDLRHAADHDALTGLANRRALLRELTLQIERCRRYGDGGALVLLDLDRLKQVNDSHGHPAGDELLVRTSRALAARVRASDVLARVGGDEFAALLTRATPAEALYVAEQLVHAARAADASVSAGVAPIGLGIGEADGVVAAADRALYAAKRAGGDRAVLGTTRPGGSGP
ncbi:MAG TPA: diguanylate cyclase [Capillimicrobium sp.]|nr:diguanylate cyclase [Capillimicrobium sp.]